MVIFCVSLARVWCLVLWSNTSLASAMKAFFGCGERLNHSTLRREDVCVCWGGGAGLIQPAKGRKSKN